MENIVGFCLMGFFLWTGYNTSTYTTQIYAQMIISGVGAAYLLIGGNLDKVKAFITKAKNITPADKTPVSIEDKSFKDFQASCYLRDRSIEIESPEALEMIVQINTALFKSRIR